MKVLSILLSILLFNFVPTGNKVEPAELIFINGNVYTANDRQPHADAVAVKGDRIVFVGTGAAVKAYQHAADLVRPIIKQFETTGYKKTMLLEIGKAFVALEQSEWRNQRLNYVGEPGRA